ncbi:TraB family protein [Desulfatibacillum aliphaticivorans]|uniref:TraB family protein n=1 Tax=Desulfatibacillum aliphaticivorans TaxID=218208 RepID=B8FMQ6_DESAL|nr:TraB/GumN family protein [Desulfatibacillum aliphaticivorans]ACL01923.1 TraB family protein [Desulfatibacillum aliphaticivorans]
MEEAVSENNGAGYPDDKDIHRFQLDGKEIVILGTAHVSKASADLVARVIQREKPDTVCVELCPSRLEAINNPDRWKEMDIVSVIKEKRAYMLLSHLLLSSFQKKIADKLEIQAGQEMMTAIQEAAAIEASVHPIDRDIRTTLARCWRLMGLKAKFSLLLDVMGAMDEADKITEEDVEALKDKDALEMVLEELGEMLPQVRTVLIDERDLYMVHTINHAPGDKVVAVVGAGHVPGIKKHFDEQIDIEELESLPPKGKLGKVFKWGIPAAIIALIAYGFFSRGGAVGVEMVGWWVGVNAFFAGLGALLALGHPLTILAAMAAAPLTSLNPMIAAGWVSGLTEAYLRKPQVKDLESLSSDIVTFRGFWKNKVTRILLVTVLSNVGSMIGTFVALPFILRAFGVEQ